MPELPEVETVRRGLEPVFTGSRLELVELRRGDLRFPFPPGFAARLAGRRVAALKRRAKYLLGELDDGETLIMHLGMSGSFRIDADDGQGVRHRAASTKAAHDHVVFHFASGASVTYNDPRRFGFMLLVPRAELAAHPLFAGLGVEPLGPELTPERLAEELRGRKAPLKAALLDQRIIAGLGNIYVCEALHRAHLSPLRAAGTLVDAKGRPKRGLVDLVEAIRRVLGEAIEAGGSSLRDHRQTDGSLGYFQHSFRVYDREDAPCPTPGCRGHISRVIQSGRSTFYCRECQK
ncbi:bifunctional DNA-formamidopyrimidine glycosylase/DNA-(apurinic or apyrimidinic site) lyase [Methylosinus sp. Ce-a6]|uniref:bifunctional DNA-formamidopyrimidine glycosylase/DNA-(apurinic or apyrimidinic site) lyase n=1 Tax=Methylosinus sp. Ce-a6 TaxID=2172005 RepID=UPI00135758A2|nr:bifunctional DNA-formamidopyrimidine glycosylase/DNA-(apurinic or apyrimidinic site) lyase [Methylosinus sp. Ce-a6]